MRERLEARLAALRGEWQRGGERLAALGDEEQTLRAKLLRIAGAIQVLEEELAVDADPASAGEATVP